MIYIFFFFLPLLRDQISQHMEPLTSDLHNFVLQKEGQTLKWSISRYLEYKPPHPYSDGIGTSWVPCTDATAIRLQGNGVHVEHLKTSFYPLGRGNALEILAGTDCIMTFRHIWIILLARASMVAWCYGSLTQGLNTSAGKRICLCLTYLNNLANRQCSPDPVSAMLLKWPLQPLPPP